MGESHAHGPDTHTHEADVPPRTEPGANAWQTVDPNPAVAPAGSSWPVAPQQPETPKVDKASPSSWTLPSAPAAPAAPVVPAAVVPPIDDGPQWTAEVAPTPPS